MLTADPSIVAKTDDAKTPACRVGGYVVSVGLDRVAFGNRLPQISCEVFRPLSDPDTAVWLVKAVTLIPASGAFTITTDMPAATQLLNPRTYSTGPTH